MGDNEDRMQSRINILLDIALLGLIGFVVVALGVAATVGWN